jgi:RimJ/RimL family protein N-acetyltransferase
VKKEPISGDGVVLRPFRETDVDDLTVACSDPLTQRFISTMPAPYTRDDAERWIGGGSEAAWAADGAAYAVADPATDRLLGAVGIDRVAPVRAQGEIGYWVAPWARGRGVATAATTVLAGHAFDDGFERLELLTEWENAASQRVALAAGFQREGVRRQAGRVPGGARYDLVAWVRLAGDPAGPVTRLLPDLPAAAPTAGDPGGASRQRGLLTDGVISLRPLDPGDEDFFHELQNQPDVVATNVPPVPADRAKIATRCARAEARWLAGEQADLVIVDNASGRPAGAATLYYQQPGLGEAMVAYSLLPHWRGRGYPTRAVRLLAGWAFEKAGIARLFGGTVPTNIGSQRVLEKAGFRREGVLRGQLPGTHRTRADDVVFGLLPEDLTDRDHPG